MLVVRFTNNKRGAALMAFHTLIEIVPVWENRIDCLASGPVVPSHNVSQKKPGLEIRGLLQRHSTVFVLILY